MSAVTRADGESHFPSLLKGIVPPTNHCSLCLCTKPLWLSFFFFLWNTTKVISKNSSTVFIRIMKVNGFQNNIVPFIVRTKQTIFSIYLLLFSTETNKSYRFKTTWGRLNDDRIEFFTWTWIRLALPFQCNKPL